MSKRGEGNRKKVVFFVTFSLQPVPAGNSIEGWKKRTPTSVVDGGPTMGQGGELYVHPNQLFYRCKPDAKKKAPTDQSTFGQWRTGEWYELSAQTMRFSRYARELFL